MTPAELLEQALGHHRAGRKAEAEALYRKLLALEPEHDQALYLASVLALEAGRLEPARELARKASELRPTNAVYALSLIHI